MLVSEHFKSENVECKNVLLLKTKENKRTGCISGDHTSYGPRCVQLSLYLSDFDNVSFQITPFQHLEARENQVGWKKMGQAL